MSNSSQPRVIDVGGNVGWYSLLSAALGAKVDYFEPNQMNYHRACESICVNGWSDEPCTGLGDLFVGGDREGKIRVFPIGIGNQEEIVQFDSGSSTRHNPGAGKIVGKSKIEILTASKNLLDIQIVALDSIASYLGWYGNDIDILKMDVEGFEVDVVRGGKSFLSSGRVKNIFMEGDVERVTKKRKFQEVIRMLASSGYSIYKIGGFAGPTETDVPIMDDNIAETLTKACATRKNGKRRKKCNLWWKLT